MIYGGVLMDDLGGVLMDDLGGVLMDDLWWSVDG